MSAVVFPRPERPSSVSTRQRLGCSKGWRTIRPLPEAQSRWSTRRAGYSPWLAVWRIPVTPLTIAADLTVIPGILLLVIFVSG